MKNKEKSKILPYVIVLIIVVIVINLFLMFYNLKILNQVDTDLVYEENENFIIQELNITNDPLSTEGYTEYKEIEISLKPQSIVFFKNCSELDIATNEFQVYTIENGLKNKIDIRPTTHDITESLIDYFNITLLQVKISETQGQHYYARAFFMQNNKLLNLDLKASDAVAMAVRANSPIYVNNKILASNSIKT